MRHDLEWVTAPPLWDLAQGDPGGRVRFRQPALLRFEKDTFMEELIGLLARGDAGVADRVARPETWEQPSAGWAPAGDPSLVRTLRLYQPVHGRFYVTAASLVCRRVGLPDRRVNVAEGESTSMVLRRLVPKPNRTFDATDPETFVEQAWIGDRKAGVWQTVTTGLATGEERLPLFPVQAAEGGRKRRLWAGMLPVASREIYEGARPADAVVPPPVTGTDPDPLEALSDPRRATFAARVSAGLIALLDSPPAGAPPAALDAAAPQMREILAFAALDLIDFLQAELPTIWDAVVASSSDGLSTPPEHAVFDALAASFAGSGTWQDALRRTEAHRPALLGTGAGTGPVPVPATFTAQQVRTAAINLIHGGLFEQAVFAALGPAPQTLPVLSGGPPVLGARAAETAEVEGAVYWLRFAYERPLCVPFHDPLVSAPSRPFRLAPFFDPDAPARPLVIRMPLDTSPKGLRKFPKGVAVLMSSKLRQQIERVRNKKVTDIEDGNLNDEPGWTIGMICSLSIPIITLCAFIVLMIFLFLLNIVFWWMAFFKICLPIPVRSE